MTVVTDPSVTPVAQTLLTCLADSLAEGPNPPRDVMYRPGATIALMFSALGDDECCQGLGWVRVVQVYPSDTFPVQNATAEPCSPMAWAALLEMGVARCAPTPEPEANPTAAEWDALQAQIMADAASMRRAICCWSANQRDRLYLPTLWQPISTEGGCAGGTQQLLVAVDACDCSDPEDS